MSLRQQTISGLSWSAASQVGKQGSQFFITAILARLLSPSDFGLIGMATVFSQFASMVGETGVTGALIQKQNLDDRHYSSIFWLNLAAGVLLMVAVIAAAPLVASFYGKPELTPILGGIAASFPLASLGVVQQAILMKQMNFKGLMVRDMAAVLAGGTAGIVTALKGFGVWSLVVQLLVFTLVNSTALWFFSSWRPSLRFSWPAVQNISEFSMHMTGFNITNYIARNVDYLLIGKFLGPEQLGLYTLAYKLMLVPLQNVSWVISRVMLPAFSLMQANLEAVRRNYLRVIKLVSLITFPMMGVLLVLAPDIVHVLYGSKWSGAVLPIQIFSFCGMVQSLTTIGGTIYQSQGRPDLQFKMSLVNAALTSIVILVSLQWGIVGVAAAYTVFTILWSQLSFLVAARLIGLQYKRLQSQILGSLIVSMIVTVELLALKHLVGFTDILLMTLLLAVGFFSYLALLIVLRQVNWNGQRISIVLN